MEKNVPRAKGDARKARARRPGLSDATAQRTISRDDHLQRSGHFFRPDGQECPSYDRASSRSGGASRHRSLTRSSGVFSPPPGGTRSRRVVSVARANDGPCPTSCGVAHNAFAHTTGVPCLRKQTTAHSLFTSHLYFPDRWDSGPCPSNDQPRRVAVVRPLKPSCPSKRRLTPIAPGTPPSDGWPHGGAPGWLVPVRPWRRPVPAGRVTPPARG
jgi:hypothetical protein